MYDIDATPKQLQQYWKESSLVMSTNEYEIVVLPTVSKYKQNLIVGIKIVVSGNTESEVS